MKTILLVGFRVFGPYRANSTQLLLNLLEGNLLAGRRVRTILFDAVIPQDNRAQIVRNAAKSFNASAIIALGMASQKRGLCIETVACNRVFNERYCRPHENNTPVDPSRPYGEKLALNLRRWNTTELISRAPSVPIHIELSQDAGGFCCNHLIYQLRAEDLRMGDDLPKIPWIYVHVPCSPECLPSPNHDSKTTLTIEQMRAGLRLLVGTTNT